ncbi:MAG TPA: tetratricopeptide repeat protein [Armatimonadota bacterium]|nr:tetratricopeptide repeat protein [Armatimonadota bacterium]
MSLLLVISAAIYFFSFWRAWNRPGMKYYLKGMDYMSAHQPAQAEVEWIKGAEADPEDYHCFEELGDYYSSVLRTQEAAACYDRAVTLHPTDGRLYLRLAGAHQALGDFKGAARAASSAVALLPDDSDAVGLYGILEAKIKDRSKAVAALKRACALAPKNGHYRLALALAEMDALEIQAAEPDLRLYLSDHPGDPEASYYMCVIYNQKPRTPENIRTAIGFAKTAIAGRPKDIRGYLALGQLYLDAGKPRLALNSFLESAKIQPNSEGALNGIEDSYTRLGLTRQRLAAAQALQDVVTRHDEIAHLKHVMGYNHFDTAAGLQLAALEDQDGNEKQAITYYEQLILQAPHDMRPRRGLSAVYKKIGEPRLAAIALRVDMLP